MYAELVNINAYHQPGVEAGKKAAGVVLDIQSKALAALADQPKTLFTADELAEAVGSPESAETIYHVLEHRAANKQGVIKDGGRYRAS